jgi:hypothetical protein
MKTFHSVVLALAIGAASITSAQARDSFSLGINIGGYGYAPPAVYYAPPPVYYSPAPVVYYQPAPRYYGYGHSYAPAVSYQYYNGGRHGFNGGHRGHGWGHRGRDHDDGHHSHHGRRDWR